jgi:hypothetical protein
MDSTLIQVFTQMAMQHGSTVDDILETPELREEFLVNSRSHLGLLPEQTLLHRLSGLRKSSRLPKTRELCRNRNLFNQE